MSNTDKYLVGLDLTKLPLGAKEVLIAIGQSQYGEPVDQLCAHCHEPILVEALSLRGEHRATSWRVSCPCTKSNTTMRGL